MSIILRPNSPREIPKRHGLAIRDEVGFSGDGDGVGLRVVLGKEGGKGGRVRVVLVETVASGKECRVALRVVLELGVEFEFFLEEGIRAENGGREFPTGNGKVDRRSARVEFSEGDGEVKSFGSDEMSVDDVVDVCPVEEVFVRTDLEGGFAGFEDVHYAGEGLTVARAVCEWGAGQRREGKGIEERERRLVGERRRTRRYRRDGERQ